MRTIDDADKLLLIQRRLSVTLLGVALLFVIFQVSNYFGDLLRILGISILFSYLFIGAVDFLQKYIRNRALCVALVYLAALGATIITALFVIPAMVYQVSGLVSTTVNEIPSWLKNLETSLLPIQERFNRSHMDIKVFDLVTQFIKQAPIPDPTAIVQRVTDMAMSTMTWSMYAISISVVSFYFLLDGHRMNRTFIAFFPETMQPAMESLMSQIDTSLQAFFKGQVVLGVLFGIVMACVYASMGVQYWLLLSAFLAICEILPVIGPPIGFAPAVVAVAIHGTVLPGARIVHILVLTAIFLILQQVKDSVIGPKYIGNVIGLHPVAIFMAIMIGARIDGMLGIILAIPAACVVNVLIAHIPTLLSHNGTYKAKDDGGDSVPDSLPVVTSESTQT